jgi:hypothetical protein
VRLEDNQPGLKVVVLLSRKCLIAGSDAGEGDARAGIAAQ